MLILPLEFMSNYLKLLQKYPKQHPKPFWQVIIYKNSSHALNGMYYQNTEYIDIPLISNAFALNLGHYFTSGISNFSHNNIAVDNGMNTCSHFKSIDFYTALMKIKLKHNMGSEEIPAPVTFSFNLPLNNDIFEPLFLKFICINRFFHMLKI